MRASHAACSAALSGALALAMIGTAASVAPAVRAPSPRDAVATVFMTRAVPTTPASPPADDGSAAPTRAATPRR